VGVRAVTSRRRNNIFKMMMIKCDDTKLDEKRGKGGEGGKVKAVIHK
jgi:hypothetical protein